MAQSLSRPESGTRHAASNHPPALGGALHELSQQVRQLSLEHDPIDLTFGVEMEFLLLGNMPRSHSGRSPKFSAIVMVYSALIEPIEAVCASCGETHSFKLPIRSPYDEPANGSKGWEVTTDCSVQLSKAERQIFHQALIQQGVDGLWNCEYGMELNSRVFVKGQDFVTTQSSTDPSHYHSITIEQEIALMLNRLDTAFNTIQGSTGSRQGIRVAVNPSCAVHVHVGNRARGFPLQTLKNLFSLYTIHERSIDSINTCDRIYGTTHAILPLDSAPGDPSHALPGHHVYNLPISNVFISNAFSLLHNAASDPGCTIPSGMKSVYPFRDFDRPHIASAARSFLLSDWLCIIQNAASIDDLKELHGITHRNTFNLENLYYPFPAGGYPGNRKATVEFRQHAGTLEADEILAWADLLNSMAEFAHTTSPAKMRAHLDKVLSSPNYNVLDLLKDLKCKDSAVQHYTLVLGQTDTGASYANVRYAKQSRELERIPAAQDPSNGARRSMLKTLAAVMQPLAVQDRILTKFKLGGYGRCSAAYLEAFRPKLSAADKKRLTDGNPVSKSSREAKQISKAYDWSSWGASVESPDLERSDYALTPPGGWEMLQPTAYAKPQARTGAPPPLDHPCPPSQPRAPTLAPVALPSLENSFEMLPPPFDALEAEMLPRAPAPTPAQPTATPRSLLGSTIPLHVRRCTNTQLIMLRRRKPVPSVDIHATERLLARVQDQFTVMGAERMLD